ncbi:MAG: S24/S26 family peptidase [Mycobacteriales bacterium]|jgi:phage repressor protein C with HTH and peptisase S24 domain
MRYRTVQVRGPSMVPTLRDGDALVVDTGATVRAGDIVLARFPSLAHRLVVKRAIRPEGAGWWLEGDNGAVRDDSRQYGPAAVLGVVLVRYWPPLRWMRGTSPPPRVDEL